jgi:hypothetical protein
MGKLKAARTGVSKSFGVSPMRRDSAVWLEGWRGSCPTALSARFSKTPIDTQGLSRHCDVIAGTFQMKIDGNAMPILGERELSITIRCYIRPSNETKSATPKAFGVRGIVWLDVMAYFQRSLKENPGKVNQSTKSSQERRKSEPAVTFVP